MESKIVNIHTHNSLDGALSITSYGVHPWHADRVTLPLGVTPFEACDAVGEIGLDRCCQIPISVQQQLFEAQIEIAAKLNKIVVIHCVKGYNEVLETLRKYTLPAVIFHGFIGSPQLMSRIIAEGYYVSYGERTFSSPKSIEALRATPLERLFLESDTSDTDIRLIYSRVSDILAISQEELRGIIYKNYKIIKQK